MSLSLWKSFLFSLWLAAQCVSQQSLLHNDNVYIFPNAQVLAEHRDVKNIHHGHTLRVVVTGADVAKEAIKYVTLEPSSPLQQSSSPFTSEALSLDFPALPLGDWNEAYIQQDEHAGTYYVVNTTRTAYPQVFEAWHHRKIEYLEFIPVRTLQQDRLQVVTHPDFASPILIKISSFPWETISLEQEVSVYRVLHGAGVTPRFLGHVSEDGRMIGFITEYIQEVPSIRNRYLPNCLETLGRLHERGIAHGDAHEGNCLIRQDGSAVLIDFELAVKDPPHEEVERDLDIMDRCIQVAMAEHLGVADLEDRRIVNE